MGTRVFLQILVVIAVAALCSGILARAEAIVGSKRDLSGVQPYRDLARWLRNCSDQAPWVLRSGPFVAFAWCLTVSAIVPIITNKLLPLAFLADLIGGAFALTPASFVMAFGYVTLRLRAWVFLMFVIAGPTAAVFKPLLRGAHPCNRI